MRAFCLRAVPVATLAAALSFAAAADEPLVVHMISGTKEYQSEESLLKLRDVLARQYGVRATLSLVQDGATELPQLELLEEADVLLIYCRRLNIEGPPLERLQAWCAAGKPVVGIRTASHAFQKWLEFDREVLGGDYSGHTGRVEESETHLVAAHRDHPLLRGVAPWRRPDKFYKNPNLAEDATLLITGSAGDQTYPLAWARVYRPERGGRAFYTSMGLPEDFANEHFLRLLANAIYWTAGREPPQRISAPGEP